MSGSLNKALIIGNLGRDPEIRSLQNGDRVASFSVAASESWRDKNSGERREKTEWLNVVVFNEHLVKVAEQYLRKGSKVYLEGKIATRKWQDKDGNDRYTTEIILQRFRGELTMLDGKPSDDGERREERQSAAGTPAAFDDGDSIPFAPLRELP